MSAPRKPKDPASSYLLTIRGIPGDVMIALEAMADAEGRFVEPQALHLIQVAIRAYARRQARLEAYGPLSVR